MSFFICDKARLLLSIYFLLDFTAHTRSIFKHFTSMNLRDGSFFKRVRKWPLECQKDIHFKTQPGTSCEKRNSKSSGWELNPRPRMISLDQRSIDWATEAFFVPGPGWVLKCKTRIFLTLKNLFNNFNDGFFE